MDRGEWDQIVAVIAANWPNNPPPEATIDKGFADLRDLPAAQVLAVVETFHRDGESFPPGSGKIRQRVVELDADTPTWGEVWPILRKAQMKAPALRGDPDERGPFLQSRGHDLIADFIEAIGWPLAEEWSDENLESRLRRKWEEWTRDRLSGRAYEGIPASGLRRLERGAAPRKIGEAAKQLLTKGAPSDG